MPERALTFTVWDAYIATGQTHVINATTTEYLIPTDNIILLD